MYLSSHLRLNNMIRIKYRQLLDDKSFAEKKKITKEMVSSETGISKTTLNRIANSPGYNVGTDAIDRLCKYFDTTPGELLEYVADSE